MMAPAINSRRRRRKLQKKIIQQEFFGPAEKYVGKLLIIRLWTQDFEVAKAGKSDSQLCPLPGVRHWVAWFMSHHHTEFLRWPLRQEDTSPDLTLWSRTFSAAPGGGAPQQPVWPGSEGQHRTVERALSLEPPSLGQLPNFSELRFPSLANGNTNSSALQGCWRNKLTGTHTALRIVSGTWSELRKRSAFIIFFSYCALTI